MPDLPDWQPLDEASPPAPSAGRVVAVVATEAAVSEGWGAGAAVRIARQWADQGARVALVDAAMAHPSLHDAVGVPNREGLADAALFGASMERVAYTPDGERFLLVTAGTAVADSGSVARDPRWHRMIGGMAEAGATLVLYLHAGAGSTAAFLGSASDIVLLAGPDEDSPSVLRDLEPLVRAVAGPGGAGMPAGAVGTPEEAPAMAAASGDGRSGKMVLFVILAAAAAAVLGLFLSSGIG